MPTKFHLNPQTGDVRPCRAFIRACKFGEDQHSLDENELHSKFEQSIAEDFLKSLQKNNLKDSKAVIVPIDSNGSIVRTFDKDDPKNKDLWAFYCKSCSNHLKRPSDAELYSDWRCSCGTVLSKDAPKEKSSLGLAVLSSDLWLLDPQQRSKGKLYHSTHNPNWDTEIRDHPNRLLHIGSEGSASQRAVQVVIMEDRPNDLFVYELELVDTESGSSTLNEDMSNNWDTELESTDKEIKNSFHLYINQHEDAGSISLLLTQQHLRVVGRKKARVSDSGVFTSTTDESFKAS